MKAFWWRAWELGRRIEGMSGRSLGTWEEHGGVSGGVSEHWRSMEELGGWICPYICSRRGEALGGVCGSLGGSGKNLGGVWEALGRVWEVLGGMFYMSGTPWEASGAGLGGRSGRRLGASGRSLGVYSYKHLATTLKLFKDVLKVPLASWGPCCPATLKPFKGSYKHLGATPKLFK